MGDFKFLSQLYQNEDILLFGNGINRINGGISWKELLEGIIRDRQLSLCTDFKKFSYPIIYEHILFSMDGNYNENLKALKKDIRERCKTTKGDGFLSHRLSNTSVSQLITTNYDYLIEHSLVENWKPTSQNSSTSAYKYSISRYRKVKNKKVWHIHGEFSDNRSVMIGNEHYADNLRRMHEELKPIHTPTKKGEKRKGLYEQLMKRKNNPYWMDFFFTRDLHIVGLNLSTDEYHLWWLFNFRARLKKIGVSIRNSITYYLPDIEVDSAKISLFNALDINIVRVPSLSGDYRAAFDYIFERI